MKNVQDEFLHDLAGLLSIPSIKNDAQLKENAPFGSAVNDALLFMLDLGKKEGFRTINHDGFVGYIEYGPENAEHYIAILCHIDVVPATGKWTTDPFQPRIVGDKIIARGAIDDKGPTMAAFYALKKLKELETSPTHRVRLIIGTDEESGMKCMQKYVEVEPPALFGFAPDAVFPIIHAEKGQLNLTLKMADTTETESDCTLLSFKAGERGNMVPDHCISTLRGKEMDKWASIIQQTAQEHHISHTLTHHDDIWTLSVSGTSAHGMEPFKGVNAAFHSARLLQKLPLSGNQATYIQFINDVLRDDYFGERMGIAHSDDVSGSLTINAGVFAFTATEEGIVSLNIRYPVSTPSDTTKHNIEKTAKMYNFQIASIRENQPHFVDEKNVGVQALIQAYEEVTNEKAQLLSTGGATYARFLDNGVAFGAVFPNKEITAHQIDEYAEISDLMKAITLYTNALQKLVHL